MDFKKLGVDDFFVKRLKRISITKPTEVQLNCLPHIFKGRDVVAIAKTGSGKSATFLLPILQALNNENRAFYAVVLTPTRELACQIGDQARSLNSNVNVLVVTGGRDIVTQAQDLVKAPHLIIATPGRLADRLRSTPAEEFNLSSVRVLVMDEVDRLIEDNFGEDLEVIMARLPKGTQRQTLLFSATFTEGTRKAVEASAETRKVAGLKPAIVWQSPDIVGDSVATTVDTLRQTYLLMHAHTKDAFLIHVVDKFTAANKRSSVIIFTNKCKWCHLLGLMFSAFGFKSVVLHSGLKQRERVAALDQFKSSQVRILIATDVASRGLDIPAVDLVVNHNVPLQPKNYIHRVGRTARAGKKGWSLILADQFEINLLKNIQTFINKKLEKLEVNEHEVAKIIAEVSVARRDAERKLDETHFDEKREINRAKRWMLEAAEKGNEKSEKGESSAEPSVPKKRKSVPWLNNKGKKLKKVKTA